MTDPGNPASATRFPDHRWNAEIKRLIDSGQVEREGERRGARYRFRITIETEEKASGQ